MTPNLMQSKDKWSVTVIEGTGRDRVSPSRELGKSEHGGSQRKSQSHRLALTPSTPQPELRHYIKLKVDQTGKTVIGDGRH